MTTNPMYPLVDDDEVDDRPIDETDGWPEHEETEGDPEWADAPEPTYTLLDEEDSDA